MPDPPTEFFRELNAAQQLLVTQWWDALSQSQQDALQTLIDAPECSLRFVERDSPESIATVPLFADDWDTTWEENWESDWREYLTEHPDVCAVTLDFMCLMVRYGD